MLKSACVIVALGSPKTVVFGWLRSLCHGFPKIGLPRMGVFRRALSDEIAKPVTHFDQAMRVGVL